MKHSAGKFTKAFRVASVALLTAAAACTKSNQAKDVAQDSILVKDADLGRNKTDTAGAATAALVRERGGGSAQLPALTNGAPVTQTPDVAPSTRAGSSTRVPPRRVNPSPVMPPRESTSGNTSGSVISPPTTPRPTSQPTPVSQPISPSPQPVVQPKPPTPKKDSSTDSLAARRS